MLGGNLKISGPRVVLQDYKESLVVVGGGGEDCNIWQKEMSFPGSRFEPKVAESLLASFPSFPSPLLFPPPSLFPSRGLPSSLPRFRLGRWVGRCRW